MNRRLLRLYPRAWRERYGAEVLDLAEELVGAGETTRTRAVLDLLLGAVVQRVVACRVALLPVGVAAVVMAGVTVVSLTANQAVRGMAEPYFEAHPAGLLAAEVTWLTLEVVGFVRRRRAGYWPGDRRGWIALAACLTGSSVAMNLAPPLVPAAAMRPDGTVFAVGIAVAVVGIALRGWSLWSAGHPHVDIGDGPMVFTGPYRWLRHPGRTGVLLAAIGLGLTSANWVGLAALTLLPLALLVWRVRLVESTLAIALGERYGRYAGDRKRLVPLIW